MDEAVIIAKIVASRTFRSSEGLGALLTFLFENRHRRIRARDIERDHYIHPPSVADPNHARERIMALREYLRRYYTEDPGDHLVCSIADGNEGLGYFVKFKQVSPGQISTANFWEPHFGPDSQPAVVCDSLLFFYEHEHGRLLRYVDTNIEGTNRTTAREQLDLRHSSHKGETLTPGHLYVDIGAVLAADALREHFWANWNRRVPLVIEKEESAIPWRGGSPILISTPRTNTFMSKLFSSPATASLGYSILSDRYATVTIKRPRPEEKRQLKRFGKRIGWLTDESFTTTSAELTIGIISRIRNPFGDGGVITFVSSDATWSTKQLAVTITKESRLRRLYDSIKWSYAQALPPTFEMLFLIELWPGNVDDEAASPQLIGWRYVQDGPEGSPSSDSASVMDDLD